MTKRELRWIRLFRAMPVVGGVVATIVFGGIAIFFSRDDMQFYVGKNIEPVVATSEIVGDTEIYLEYIDINEYSRPGIPLEHVEKIVVHYTGNPGSTAQGNRDYFNNLQYTHKTYASSHFVIGLEGEIIQCVPLNEIAYASNEENQRSISIECCHPDEEGEFTTATYNQCVKLVIELCKYYQLDPREDVIRHYDVTGKICPKFYVDHPEEWDMFIGFVEQGLKQVQ